MMKNFEDFQSVGKDQLDAAVASATAMTKGMQTIATELADYSKKSFEDGSAVLEQAMAAKSLDKAVEVQTTYARTAYEAYVGQMSKIGEIYMNAAKEAYRPFEAQIAGLSGKATGKKSS